jgi:hypothetical protein
MIEGDLKMIPKKNEVLAHARELFFQQAYRSGMQNVNTPENSELLEGGFYGQAVSELMTNVERKNEKWISSVSETSEFTIDVQQLFESNALILGSRHTGKSDIAMLISDKATLEKAIVVVFDPSQDWIARSNIKRYVKVEPYSVLEVPSESVIYDVSLCAPQDQERIVENFARKLFDCQAQAENRRQYLVIFEEAHTYFSQGCMRAQNMANCVRLLSVGRNVDIAAILVSQFASMLDKFAIKHSTSQAWFGFTREPNDIKYLKGILGAAVEKLSKLQDGQFLYLTRSGLSKINIEPFEAMIEKQQIVIPQPERTELIKSNQNVSIIPFAKLFILLGFAVLVLNSLRGR